MADGLVDAPAGYTTTSGATSGRTGPMAPPGLPDTTPLAISIERQRRESEMSGAHATCRAEAARGGLVAMRSASVAALRPATGRHAA
ncbi:hypothetical protein [Falsiroseomonas sp.]|uniref:hypothetical protein n=1 Tax=Falsiroseomonas sp. TaxID=2870721 RepID=UPI00273703AB|nr:hypothetical protein [Falsiroseomonas sp.]MDP3416088.1 hypothetical protein [Falsiroseomonas sp.]